MTFPDPPPWEQESRSDEQMEVSDSDRRTTWVATAVLLLGVLLLGLAVALQIVWVGLVGVVLAGGAAFVAWRSGVMRDVKH